MSRIKVGGMFKVEECQGLRLGNVKGQSLEMSGVKIRE